MILKSTWEELNKWGTEWRENLLEGCPDTWTDLLLHCHHAGVVHINLSISCHLPPKLCFCVKLKHSTRFPCSPLVANPQGLLLWTECGQAHSVPAVASAALSHSLLLSCLCNAFGCVLGMTHVFQLVCRLLHNRDHLQLFWVLELDRTWVQIPALLFLC